MSSFSSFPDSAPLVEVSKEDVELERQVRGHLGELESYQSKLLDMISESQREMAALAALKGEGKTHKSAAKFMRADTGASLSSLDFLESKLADLVAETCCPPRKNQTSVDLRASPQVFSRFHRQRVGGNVKLSVDGVVASLGEFNSSSSVCFGDAPAKLVPQGLYYEVILKKCRKGGVSEDGLTLGLTLTPPESMISTPAHSWDVPDTWLLGFDGKFHTNTPGEPGCLGWTPLDWDPSALKPSDSVGLFVPAVGKQKGHIFLFKNQEFVCSVQANVPVDCKLVYPVVEMMGVVEAISVRDPSLLNPPPPREEQQRVQAKSLSRFSLAGCNLRTSNDGLLAVREKVGSGDNGGNVLLGNGPMKTFSGINFSAFRLKKKEKKGGVFGLRAGVICNRNAPSGLPAKISQLPGCQFVTLSADRLDLRIGDVVGLMVKDGELAVFINSRLRMRKVLLPPACMSVVWLALDLYAGCSAVSLLPESLPPPDGGASLNLSDAVGACTKLQSFYRRYRRVNAWKFAVKQVRLKWMNFQEEERSRAERDRITNMQQRQLEIMAHQMALQEKALVALEKLNASALFMPKAAPPQHLHVGPIATKPAPTRSEPVPAVAAPSAPAEVIEPKGSKYRRGGDVVTEAPAHPAAGLQVSPSAPSWGSCTPGLEVEGSSVRRRLPGHSITWEWAGSDSHALTFRVCLHLTSPTQSLGLGVTPFPLDLSEGGALKQEPSSMVFLGSQSPPITVQDGIIVDVTVSLSSGTVTVSLPRHGVVGSAPLEGGRGHVAYFLCVNLGPAVARVDLLAPLNPPADLPMSGVEQLPESPAPHPLPKYKVGPKATQGEKDRRESKAFGSQKGEGRLPHKSGCSSFDSKAKGRNLQPLKEDGRRVDRVLGTIPRGKHGILGKETLTDHTWDCSDPGKVKDSNFEVSYFFAVEVLELVPSDSKEVDEGLALGFTLSSPSEVVEDGGVPRRVDKIIDTYVLGWKGQGFGPFGEWERGREVRWAPLKDVNVGDVLACVSLRSSRFLLFVNGKLTCEGPSGVPCVGFFEHKAAYDVFPIVELSGNCQSVRLLPDFRLSQSMLEACRKISDRRTSVTSAVFSAGGSASGSGSGNSSYSSYSSYSSKSRRTGPQASRRVSGSSSFVSTLPRGGRDTTRSASRRGSYDSYVSSSSYNSRLRSQRSEGSSYSSSYSSGAERSLSGSSRSFSGDGSRRGRRSSYSSWSQSGSRSVSSYSSSSGSVESGKGRGTRGKPSVQPVPVKKTKGYVRKAQPKVKSITSSRSGTSTVPRGKAGGRGSTQMLGDSSESYESS